MSKSVNIAALETVVAALDILVEQMVFTGGSVVELYSEKRESTEARVTKDVDSIVAASTLVEYQKLEQELHQRGFINVGLVGEAGSICRYKYKDVLIDIMPLYKAALGFDARFFKDALSNPFQKQLPSGSAIKLVTFPRFIALKLNAMSNRGGNDLRGSHDLEDIVRLLDSRRDPVGEIKKESPRVRNYIQNTFRERLKNENFGEAIQSSAPEGFEQAQRIFDMLQTLTEKAGERKGS